MKEKLTRSTLFHFLRGGRKYIQHLNRYLNHFVRHSGSQWDSGIYLEPSKKTFDTSKEVY